MIDLLFLFWPSFLHCLFFKLIYRVRQKKTGQLKTHIIKYLNNDIKQYTDNNHLNIIPLSSVLTNVYCIVDILIKYLQ